MTRERKIILVVGAVLLLAGAVYRFWPAAGIRTGSGEATAKKLERLERYRAVAAQKDRLQSEWVALNRALAGAENALLSGSTPALAGVDLQNILTDVAGRSEIDIRSMRMVSGRNEEALFPTVRVQVHFQGTVSALQKFLYRIEAYPKLLRIAEARFQAPGGAKGGAIQGNLTVEGLMPGKAEG